MSVEFVLLLRGALIVPAVYSWSMALSTRAIIHLRQRQGILTFNIYTYGCGYQIRALACQGRAYNPKELSLAESAIVSYMAAAYAELVENKSYSHAFGYRCFALAQVIKEYLRGIDTSI